MTFIYSSLWISIIIISGINHVSAFSSKHFSRNIASKSHSWNHVNRQRPTKHDDKRGSTTTLAAIEKDFSMTNGTTAKNDWTSSQPPPLLAIITETDAASSKLRMEQTIEALSKAMQSGKVDLISIRCIPNNNETINHHDDDDDESRTTTTTTTTCLNSFQENVITLTRRVISCRDEIQRSLPDSENRILRVPKVVINDNLEAVLASNADGIHVKERNRNDIPQIRSILDQEMKKTTIIGTSCHSISSGKESTLVDYLFVGTCYKTLSHPEKTTDDDLEGPSLPGLVRQALFEEEVEENSPVDLPKIFAIGGINSVNCWEPVQKGADGVAIIRSIMQADDPKLASQSIHDVMNREKDVSIL